MPSLLLLLITKATETQVLASCMTLRQGLRARRNESTLQLACGWWGNSAHTHCMPLPRSHPSAHTPRANPLPPPQRRTLAQRYCRRGVGFLFFLPAVCLPVWNGVCTLQGSSSPLIPLRLVINLSIRHTAQELLRSMSCLFDHA